MLSTHRLSPKNQVTIPRGRALAGSAEVSHLRGLPLMLAKPGTSERFPYVMLLTESEMQRREQAILNDANFTGEQKLQAITLLNGRAANMAMDAQNRIVLAQNLIEHLKLSERDVFFVDTNTALQAWNPEHYKRWAGLDEAQPPAIDLDRFLAI